ncbi:NACHT, LRR and PYD domains-containing protein 12-like [Engraulis encrasicolus]|uniref:NACHT, LRR and PYD domains-containing protein 12-like n=1 Tax=Engraulis encrasicolus TaxID=184585 RepID=UPI002FD216E4
MKSDRSIVQPPNIHTDPGPPEESDVSMIQPRNVQTDPGPPEERCRCDIAKEVQRKVKAKIQSFCKMTEKQECLTFTMETNLHLTEGECGEISTEHEVHRNLKAPRSFAEDQLIKCHDIFKQHEQNKPIKTVLTQGVAGIGKTVSVHRFMLDWAEGKASTDIDLIFPIPFRELNLMKEKLSLMGMIHSVFPEVKELGTCLHNHKVMFIFDGLDECRLLLKFDNTGLSDPFDPLTVDEILTNLISGNLLPSALIWITSRPAAAGRIPQALFDRVTEARGFRGSQKYEYFERKILDQEVASDVIKHMKATRSLCNMCHIPLFCWIAATIFEKMFVETEEVPKTLTEVYTHYLMHQMKLTRDKYSGRTPTCQEILFKLGNLAYMNLKQGNLIFYEEDLRKCGLTIEDAAVYSGLCTQIFSEKPGLSQKKVYTFVHLTIQEHLAALFVFLSFKINGENMLYQDQSEKSSEKTSLYDLQRQAVDEAFESEHGQLDLFLQFFLGFSVQSSQALIGEFLEKTWPCFECNDAIVKYIKEKIRATPSPERCLNLFHCLNELKDCSLVEEIQSYLSSGILSKSKLSPTQWSALVFVLLMSEDELQQFELRKYVPSDEGLRMLLPVVKASIKAVLRGCELTARSCAILDLPLKSGNLKELDMSHNALQDSGIEHLCSSLTDLSCKLECLQLSYCSIGERGVSALASYLCSGVSSLKELDLSYSKPGDEGFRRLSEALANPNCKVERLYLFSNMITTDGCKSLASAMQSGFSCLKELDLGFNQLKDIGLKHLSDGLPNCNLEILGLYKCQITEEGCRHLALALTSSPSHLRKLNLSHNSVGDSGVQYLATILQSPNCKLEILK